MTKREALLSMNYREVVDGKWFKPIGYHSFSFMEHSNEWVNWFIGGKGDDAKLMRWESRIIIDDENFLSKLKMLEAYTRTNIERSEQSHFELKAFDL